MTARPTPPDGTGSPGPRVTHALLDTVAVLLVKDCPALAARVESAIVDVAAMHEYIETQEKNLRVMCESSYAAAHRETALLKKLDEVSAMAERFLALEAERHERGAAQFMLAVNINSLVRAETIRPYSITNLKIEPRTAAGA